MFTRSMGAAFLSVVIVCGVVAGCDDPPPEPSIDAFCGGICHSASYCDTGVTWQDCYDGCRSDSRNQSLWTVRPEAAAVVKGCLSSLNCATILNGPYDACWDRARAETPASAHLIAFCPSYSAAAFECGDWFSVEDCQTKLNIWSDQFLDALAECTRRPTCEATNACLENVFGGT